MPIDKSWIELNRSTSEYINGVERFLDFAFRNNRFGDSRIFCPCIKCNNRYRKVRSEVQEHLVCKGMKRGYTIWYCHGENGESDNERENDSEPHDTQYNDVRNLIEEAYPRDPQEPNIHAQEFYKLLEECEQPLYPSCENFSNLSFLVKLMHIKCINGWSNKSLDMLLDLLKEAFPMCEKLPTSHYEAKKIVKDLGLHYEKIDACQNDCILYYKEYGDALQCPICQLPRWKHKGNNDKRKGKNVPWKVLRYFPITSRLQRLFMSSKTAASMRWHFDNRVKDGLLRHPADCEAWKKFDEEHKTFSEDSRNVRLGLATDGFNPFGNMNVAHSTWPILLFPYNLPPWMCMKEPYTFMSLLIPGPKGPGKDIDVYLRPLIDELKELWKNGVNTYDISTQQNFQMKAAIMWTVNDFPAYAYMSGWSTKGKLACPCCANKTDHFSLHNGSKICYMGHRRFLPNDHPWRNQRSQFNGKKIIGGAPKRPASDEVLKELEGLTPITFGKLVKKQKIAGFGENHNWNKHSIFFQLPYWSTLELRHSLDVMHIEKNVCDNVLGTIFNIDGKTKDNINARLDLQAMGLRRELHPVDMNGRIVLPTACYTLSNVEKRLICEWLVNIKVPDGYSSNLSRCVNVSERKISGMKTHDCHVFLERLLPLIVREFLPRHVIDALTELSNFFKELCAKVLNKDDLDKLQEQIALTLCKLERIFPPAFFDIMLHLPIHLVWEAKVAGPVQYRWMYPIERYLRKLKAYVRNKAKPEGSIAEGYLADECLTFCSRYLRGVETKFNRPERNYDGGQSSANKISIFSTSGRLYGKLEVNELDPILHNAAVLYVLENCDESLPFVRDHKNVIVNSGCRNVEQTHREEFISWFREKIKQLYNDGQTSKDMLSLARGPERRVNYHPCYNINGYKFHTTQRDEAKNTQNNGVMVHAENHNDVPYYGILKDIVELCYTEGNRVVLFNCEWFDTVREGIGFRRDRCGNIVLNTTKRLCTQEPFVLASQVIQVYYVKGIKDPTWSAAIEIKPRNLFEMSLDEGDLYQEEQMQSLEGDPYQEEQMQCPNIAANLNENQEDELKWIRNVEDNMDVE